MFRVLGIVFVFAMLPFPVAASGWDKPEIEQVEAQDVEAEEATKEEPVLVKPPALVLKTSPLQKLEYDVYAGGIQAVEADMTVDVREEGRYSLVFGAQTRGMLETFVPWKGTFESKGWTMEDGTRRPELHESVAMWRDEREVKSYNYTKNGGFQDIVTTYVGKKPRTRTPDEALTKDTTDVLSATLMVMAQVAKGEGCNGSSEVFDGKRRYELNYKQVRHVHMEATRYNVYSGPAVECTVEVNPLAGAWHKKPRGWMSIQEQGRARGTMPTVWFGKVGANSVAVPVRVRVKTAYGAMFMHLTSYESGDVVLAAKK